MDALFASDYTSIIINYLTMYEIIQLCDTSRRLKHLVMQFSYYVRSLNSMFCNFRLYCACKGANTCKLYMNNDNDEDI